MKEPLAVTWKRGFDGESFLSDAITPFTEQFSEVLISGLAKMVAYL
jgi:hypothetical protein